VKNYDFMQKNHIFSNCGGRREIFGVFGVSDNLPFLNYDRDGGHLGINMKNKDFPKIAGF
jgi:hypothetical protein